jgi:hypothetical protein
MVGCSRALPEMPAMAWPGVGGRRRIGVALAIRSRRARRPSTSGPGDKYVPML